MDIKELNRKLQNFLSGNKPDPESDFISYVYYLRRCATQRYSPDKEKMWRQIRKSIYKIRRRKRIRQWTVAASIVIAVISGVEIFLSHQERKINTPFPLVVNTKQISLKLNNGQVIQVRDLEKDSVLEESGTGIFIHPNQSMSYQISSSNTSQEEVYNVLTVPRSCEYHLRLADGTEVWLNSDSELRYPVKFINKERRVFLKGEAYFQVKEDSLRPFRVEAKGMVTEVLGTAFNINVYGDDQTLRTTLVEGKIKVSYPDTHQECILRPGEQAILSKGELYVENVSVEDIVGWKKGRFSFNNMTLESIAKQLERWYDVEIRFQNDMAKYYRFTGIIKRYNDLSQILGFIEETTNVQFQYDGNIVKVFCVK